MIFSKIIANMLSLSYGINGIEYLFYAIIIVSNFIVVINFNPYLRSIENVMERISLLLSLFLIGVQESINEKTETVGKVTELIIILFTMILFIILFILSIWSIQYIIKLTEKLLALIIKYFEKDSKSSFFNNSNKNKKSFELSSQNNLDKTNNSLMDKFISNSMPIDDELYNNSTNNDSNIENNFTNSIQELESKFSLYYENDDSTFKSNSTSSFTNSQEYIDEINMNRKFSSIIINKDTMRELPSRMSNLYYDNYDDECSTSETMENSTSSLSELEFENNDLLLIHKFNQEITRELPSRMGNYIDKSSKTIPKSINKLELDSDFDFD